jgi:hypothetical protein
MTVVSYPPFIKDMPERPIKFPAASERAKGKNFSPSIKKVESLIKERSAEFKVGTTTIYGLE